MGNGASTVSSGGIFKPKGGILTLPKVGAKYRIVHTRTEDGRLVAYYATAAILQPNADTVDYDLDNCVKVWDGEAQGKEFPKLSRGGWS